MHESPIESSLRRDAWIFALVAGVAIAVLTNFVLPDDHAALDWLYLGGLLAASLLMVVGIRSWSAPKAVVRGWSLIAVGMFLYFAGESVWTWYARTDRDPFPSIADALFLSGLGAMIVGSIMLVVARRDHVDRAVQLDTAIVSVSIGAVLWTLTIAPYAVDPSVSLLEQAVAGAYPMLDVILAGTVARLLLAGGRIPQGFVLLLGGIGFWTIVDVLYYQQELNGTYVEWGWIDFGYMVGFAITGASALHRGAPHVADMPEKPTMLGAARVAMLAGFAGLPLGLIALVGPLGLDVNISWLAIASCVLIGLVVARTWSMIVVNRQIGELRTQARYTSMIRNSADGIIIVDEEKRIAYASPSLSNNWGWREGELLGAHLHVLLLESSVGLVDEWFDRIIAGAAVGGLQTKWRGTGIDGRDVSMVASDLRDDPEIAGVVVTARDISDHKQLEHQLKHDASHDVLTGLANRAAFTEAARENRNELAAVAFIDVDDFKDINDARGHEAGDVVLIELAQRFSKCMRPQDLVARLGGDEFGILVRDATDADLGEVAKRIVGVGEREIRVGDSAIHITVSVGFARLTSGLDGSDGLRNADLAMYQAKRSGKGQSAVYSPDMLDRAERRLDLRAGLATAIENDELFLAYQNIVRPTDGVVAGREALLRWELPDGSRISPAEMIPIAEETGAIVEIGEWVLRTACRDAMDWPLASDGSCPLVSVNVSAVQLRGDFSSVVAQVLHESGLPADRLQLELTESLMAEPCAATAFQNLNRLGVRLAIDDFGTGYCSLAYLQQFSVDVIKIDRELVHGSSNNPRLLAGIAGLISAVGATAVAEGVEESVDRDLLVELGIPLGQGYLWHRPSEHRTLQLEPAMAAGTAMLTTPPAGRALPGPLAARS